MKRFTKTQPARTQAPKRTPPAGRALDAAKEARLRLLILSRLPETSEVRAAIVNTPDPSARYSFLRVLGAVLLMQKVCVRHGWTGEETQAAILRTGHPAVSGAILAQMDRADRLLDRTLTAGCLRRGEGQD